jgi:hypothetical protein
MAVVRETDPLRARPGWLLDEVASAGRENLDAAHLERYDRKVDARALDEIALLRSAGLGARRWWSISGQVPASSPWQLPPYAGESWPWTRHP